MASSKIVQYRFSKGELDPRLDGRSDLEQYYSTAKKIENAIVLPQGGVSRRPGLRHLGEVRRVLSQYAAGSITVSAPNGGTGANLKDGNLTTFLETTNNVSTTNGYVVFQLQFGSAQTVAFVDLELVSLTSGSSTEFKIEYGPDGSNWTASPRTLTLDTTVRDYRITLDVLATYIRLVRIGSTDLGTAKVKIAECNVFLETATLSQTRMTPFQFNDEQDYLLVWSDRNLAIFREGALQTNVASPYTSAQLSTINFAQSADTAVYVHKDVTPYELKRQGGDTLWSFNPITFTNIPKYNYSVTRSSPAVTLKPSATNGTVTLTAGSGTPFASAVPGEYIYGNGGTARILKKQSDTVVDAVVIIDFYNDGTILSGQWQYETGWEDIWSTTRGYPRAVTFYQQRLVFGGLRSRPQTIVASVINEFYNLDQGGLNDNEAIVYTLDTDQANVIYHLFAHNSLEVFTSSGEFVVVPDKTFTPTSITIRRQSQIGCSPLIRPVEIENGGTLFVQKDGRSVSEFVFSDTTLSYENRRISLLASHLINNPVDASLRRTSEDQEANYYMQVNADGILVLATLLESQNIVAFTRHTTDGLFKNCVAVDENMYAVVERIINGTSRRFIEELDFNRNTDACAYYAVGSLGNPDQVTGLQYLNGKSVWLIIDGSVFGPVTVPVSGTIDLPKTVTEDIEVGLDFDVAVQTNPIESPQVGSMMGRLKTIPELTVNLFETQHILVNGYSPFLQQLGNPSTLDAKPKSWTDRFRMTGFLGWDNKGIVTITQDFPLSMTLLNLATTFNFSNK